MHGSTTKIFQYRRARYLKNDGNLQALLVAALRKKNKVGSRMEPLDEGQTYHRLINYHRQKLGMLFGNMFLYSDGTNQLMLIADHDAESFPIEQIAPPAGRDGKRREFLESILYFGVNSNHVVMVQSSGLRGKQFEQHVNWLLRETETIVPCRR